MPNGGIQTGSRLMGAERREDRMMAPGNALSFRGQNVLELDKGEMTET